MCIQVWKSRRFIRFARVTFSAAPTVMQLRIETYTPSHFKKKASLLAGLDSPEADPQVSTASPNAQSTVAYTLAPVNIGGSRTTLASASASGSSSPRRRREQLREGAAQGAHQLCSQRSSLRANQSQRQSRVLRHCVGSATFVRRVEFRSTVACVAVGTLNSVFYNATGLLAIAHYALLPPSVSRGVLLRVCASGKLLAHSLNLFVYALIIPSFRTQLWRTLTSGLRHFPRFTCRRFRRSSLTD